MKIKHAIYATIALMLVLSAKSAADKPLPPPPPERFLGAWVGYDSHLASFYRLELEADGKGFCGKSLADQPASLYLVERWEVKGHDLTVDLKPIDNETNRIFLRSISPVGSSILLEMEVGSVDGSWKRKLELFHEDQWLLRSRTLKEGISKFREQNAGKNP